MLSNLSIYIPIHTQSLAKYANTKRFFIIIGCCCWCDIGFINVLKCDRLLCQFIALLLNSQNFAKKSRECNHRKLNAYIAYRISTNALHHHVTPFKLHPFVRTKKCSEIAATTTTTLTPTTRNDSLVLFVVS